MLAPPTRPPATCPRAQTPPACVSGCAAPPGARSRGAPFRGFALPEPACGVLPESRGQGQPPGPRLCQGSHNGRCSRAPINQGARSGTRFCTSSWAVTGACGQRGVCLGRPLRTQQGRRSRSSGGPFYVTALTRTLEGSTHPEDSQEERGYAGDSTKPRRPGRGPSQRGRRPDTGREHCANGRYKAFSFSFFLTTL